jgi:type II secretory pathway component PulJ
MIALPNKIRKSKIERAAGFTLLEVSVAGALLFVLMVVAVQMLAWVASERRALVRRQWAAQEAANVMERIVAQPFDRVSSDPATAFELSEAARQVLPEAQLHVNVSDEPGQPAAKRIVVAVEWRPRPDQPAARVALTSWIYRREGTEP